jgi:lipopolysaccharide biosynthesis glycosyltransferase
MQDTIHIALALHDPTGNYYCNVGATLASTFSRTSSPVCAHILHDDTLSADNKNKLQLVAQRWGKEIRFYQIELPEEISSLGGIWTKGALYRCLLPDLVEASKIIYLDWDTIVNMDIIELWEIDLKDLPLAAALDPAIPQFTPEDHLQIFQRAGVPLQKYFNSGVMVLNLNCLRQKYQLFQQLIDFLRRCPECLCPDQDALNYLFQDHYLQLETRFNKFTYYQETDCDLPAIWHITGPGGKAWQFYATPMHILYWKALALTPWQDTLLDRMSEVIDRTMVKIQRHISYYRKTCDALVENLTAEVETLTAYSEGEN